LKRKKEKTKEVREGRDESSLFIKFFGDYPLVRVLDFLMENQLFDYSLREIAEHSGVGFSTLNLFWVRLARFGIVVETRKVGKATMYGLNIDAPLVKRLIDFDMKLAFAETNNKELEVEA